jgi:hypothetical protein
VQELAFKANPSQLAFAGTELEKATNRDCVRVVGFSLLDRMQSKRRRVL